MPIITLTDTESRVLGTLVEKAQTVPGQYPLTLNGLVVGCNQKNNRDPVTNLSEDDVLDAIDGLRTKGLVREAMLAGSRVHKYRHIAREALGVGTGELALLTELLLRGPQAAGELRGRAMRLLPPGDQSLATLESTAEVLAGLASRDPAMVRRLPRRPGERAERWVQLLCADLHPLDGPVGAAASDDDTPRPAGASRPSRSGDDDASAARIAELQEQVTALREAVRRIASAVGIDPGV